MGLVNKTVMTSLPSCSFDSDVDFFSFDTSDFAAWPIFTWRPPATILGRAAHRPAYLRRSAGPGPILLVRHLRLRDADSQGRSSAAQRSLAFPPRPQLLRPWLILLFYYLWPARGAGQFFVTVLTEYACETDNKAIINNNQ